MRSLAVLFLYTLLVQAFEYHLVPKKLVPGVYCFFGKPENISKENGGNMVNTCFVQTREGFVVIDSGPTYDYAAQAYAQMQKIAKLPVKYVIITHDHDDHWQGNSFYKNKGALLIGPRTYEQNVVAGMQTRMERVLGKKLYGKTKIVKIDRVVEKNTTLRVGDKRFEIRQPVAMAHTKGDLIVYLPKTKVFFAGDLLFSDRLTSLRDGSLIGSIKALDVIDSYGAKVLIGGHGYRTDANATRPYRAYLTELKEAVLKALDEDIGMEVITKKVVMPHYKQMKLYDALHARNVLDAYRELEMWDEEGE